MRDRGDIEAERPPGGRAAWSVDDVGAALADAGAALLALPAAGDRPGVYKTAWPEIQRIAALGDYPGAVRIRPAAPDAAAIGAMECRLSWPARFIVSPARRRIVALRLLERPISRRPLYSWREIGAQLHIAANTARTWHTSGLADIARGLNAAAAARDVEGVQKKDRGQKQRATPGRAGG